MKKLLLSFILLSCFIISANAQTEQGAKLIGGSGTLHIDTEGPNKSTIIALAPRAGYFVANNVAIGAALPLQYSFNDIYNSYSVGLTPFVRGYFGSSPTKFLLEGRAGYNRIGFDFEDDYPFGIENESEGYFIFGLGAGVTHFINEHVGVELMLNYDKTDVSSTGLVSSGLDGINLNIGFQIYLPSKK